MSQMHIRMLLGQMDLGDVNLDMLAVQLTAALDGPLLLYLSASELIDAVPQTAERIAQSWQDLVQRVCRP
jgi:polyketide synthase 12